MANKTNKNCENCKYSKIYYLLFYKSFRCENNYSKHYCSFKDNDFKCSKWAKLTK